MKSGLLLAKRAEKRIHALITRRERERRCDELMAAELNVDFALSLWGRL
jgi:hypothetical protein